MAGISDRVSDINLRNDSGPNKTSRPLTKKCHLFSFTLFSDEEVETFLLEPSAIFVKKQDGDNDMHSLVVDHNMHHICEYNNSKSVSSDQCSSA